MLALVSAMAPSSASAQTVQANTIDLPAMPMAETLQAIAARTGETINYDPDAVRG
ncbi:hypothetical protein ACRAWD_02345 [Caulobacter segnis]